MASDEHVEIMSALRRVIQLVDQWRLTTVYIAILLTIWFLLKLVGTL